VWIRLRAWSVAPLVALVLVAVVTGACSSDEDPTDEGGGSTTTTFGPINAPAALPESPAGSGAIALGGEVRSFQVTGCALQPNLDEPENARTLLKLEGEGEARGAPFSVEVLRFLTGGRGAVTTFTDSVDYQDNARVFRAQRIEVDGAITDPLDPAANTPMVQSQGGRVTALGVFGPLGASSGEDRVAFRLDATCPAS
jgi:hypothetical protein